MDDGLTTRLHKKNIVKKLKLEQKPRDRDTDKQTWTRPGLQDFRIGTWNIRTLYKAGALKTLTDTLERYKVQLVALQETRLPGEGCITTGNSSLIYGGITNNKHENGVGFLVNKKLIPWVKKFRAINDRICYIQINMKHRNLAVICTYAPTENSHEETKDTFYEQLEHTCDSIPRYYTKIIVGDLNAQVGREEEYKQTAGSYSYHENSNNNGIRLINFAILPIYTLTGYGDQ